MRIDDVIGHFLLDCENRGLSLETIKLYRVLLGITARKLEQVCRVKVEGREVPVTELEQVQIVHLRQFVQLLLNTKVDENHPRRRTQDKLLSVQSVRGYVRVLKVFFRWCVNEDLLDMNPATRLAQPKAPTYVIRAFTPEHIEKMLSACDVSTPLGFRDYVILLVFLDTGMRLSEISTLKVADVHDRYIKVLGKGRKEREIGLHPEVSKLLWKYIHKYRKPVISDETALFLNRFGKPLLKTGVVEIVERVKDTCGFKDVRVSAHTFRHTFAKMYLERGGEIFKLSREMGHSQVQITESYLKDFKSAEARKEHVDYSPIGQINLYSTKKSGKQKNSK